MTIKAAREALKPHGMRILTHLSFEHSTWPSKYQVRGKTEFSNGIYFTDDLQDAVKTGIAMKFEEKMWPTILFKRPYDGTF
jgi:hypothetical protein